MATDPRREATASASPAGRMGKRSPQTQTGKREGAAHVRAGRVSAPGRGDVRGGRGTAPPRPDAPERAELHSATAAAAEGARGAPSESAASRGTGGGSAAAGPPTERRRSAPPTASLHRFAPVVTFSRWKIVLAPDSPKPSKTRSGRSQVCTQPCSRAGERAVVVCDSCPGTMCP